MGAQSDGRECVNKAPARRGASSPAGYDVSEMGPLCKMEAFLAGDAPGPKSDHPAVDWLAEAVQLQQRIDALALDAVVIPQSAGKKAVRFTGPKATAEWKRNGALSTSVWNARARGLGMLQKGAIVLDFDKMHTPEDATQRAIRCDLVQRNEPRVHGQRRLVMSLGRCSNTHAAAVTSARAIAEILQRRLECGFRAVGQQRAVCAWLRRKVEEAEEC